MDDHRLINSLRQDENCRGEEGPIISPHLPPQNDKEKVIKDFCRRRACVTIQRWWKCILYRYSHLFNMEEYFFPCMVDEYLMRRHPCMVDEYLMHRQLVAGHRGFQSLVPGFSYAEAMNTVVKKAICYQHLFDRKTSPTEVNLWASGVLENRRPEFTINLECVDRLYHIHEEGNNMELVVRMEHKGRPLFVELNCKCYFDFVRGKYRGGGLIYVSYSASLFTKVIATKLRNEASFYESLAQDGYLVEAPSEHERWPARRWHTAPSLKVLCHLAISSNSETLRRYPAVLPAALTRSVDEFVYLQEAMKDYDKWVRKVKHIHRY
nr:MAG: wsv447-like protein [Sesarmops intermedium nimavirus]